MSRPAHSVDYRKWLVAVIVVVTAVVVASGGGAEATFNPTSSAEYCNRLPSAFPLSKAFTDTDLAGSPGCSEPNPITPNAALDLTLGFDVPGGDQLGIQFWLLSPEHTIATDAGIPDGEKVGGVSSVTTLGVLGGPCATTITTDFVLYDSSTSGSLATSPPGTSNRFASIVTDADANGIADASSPFIGTNPDMYGSLFDPDLDYPGGPNGPIGPITPLARYSGATQVPAGLGDWIVLSYFTFAPGALAAFDADPDNSVHPFGRVSRTTFLTTLGTPKTHAGWYFMLPVLQDPTSPIASVSPITDICAPLGSQAMFLGVTPGGDTRMTTPPHSTGVDKGGGTFDGTHLLAAYGISERDADGDGRANSLDSCPFNASAPSDSDSDGIDDVCDGGGFGTDVDGDAFLNRGDNCAQEPNATQSEAETTNTYIVAAPDGGGKSDGIGDPCDGVVSLTNPGGLGTADLADGSFFYGLTVVEKCVWDTGQGAPPADCGDPDTDIDADYFTDAIELGVGTDPLENCAKTTSQDAWPPDFDNNTVINIIDVLALKPVFNSPSPRHDLNASGGNVNIIDVLALKPVFNKDCDTLFLSP